MTRLVKDCAHSMPCQRSNNQHSGALTFALTSNVCAVQIKHCTEKNKTRRAKKKDSNNKLTTQPNASSVVAFWASFLCSGEIKMKLEFLQTASLRACFDFVADGTADVVVVVIAILTALSAACACIGIFYMLTVCVFYKSFCFAAAFWRAIFVLSRCCVALSVVAVVVVTVVICISRFAACLIRNSSYKHNNNKQT